MPYNGWYVSRPAKLQMRNSMPYKFLSILTEKDAFRSLKESFYPMMGRIRGFTRILLILFAERRRYRFRLNSRVMRSISWISRESLMIREHLSFGPDSTDIARLLNQVYGSHDFRQKSTFYLADWLRLAIRRETQSCNLGIRSSL